jgi:ribosome-associated protein
VKIPQDEPGDSIIELAPHVHVRRASLRFTFSRSSGPGGQAVNKIATRAQLRVRIDHIHGLDDAGRGRLRSLAGQRLVGEDEEILIEAQTHRSQLANKEVCIEKLQQLVRQAARPPRKRRKTKPSRGAIEKRLQTKRQTSERKQRRRPDRDQ